jgi:hypothetical protein
MPALRQLLCNTESRQYVGKLTVDDYRYSGHAGLLERLQLKVGNKGCHMLCWRYQGTEKVHGAANAARYL